MLSLNIRNVTFEISAMVIWDSAILWSSFANELMEGRGCRMTS
jgi:hypothetical protein